MRDKMRKNTEISNEKYTELINEFYSYFETGYAFEDFLKIYFEKIGLDEVTVTQRSCDNGIDLKARRNGIGDFSDADKVDYYIQAKRNKPSSSIPVSKIRELKGVISSGCKGIFVTTSKFSHAAIKESDSDPSRPVILIDGKLLVDSCIEHEIGFVFTPKFNEAAMNKLTGKTKEKSNSYDANIVVEKRISSNDIRARIMPIPKIILEQFPSGCKKYEVTINNEFSKILTIDKRRNYFASVTEIFRKYGLLADDGTFNPGKATWYWNNGTLNIVIGEEEV
jgi:restriction system protein